MHIHMAMTAVPQFPEFDIKAVSTETVVNVNTLRRLRAKSKPESKVP